MVDAELLIRFLGFQIGSLTYKGNLKVFLDDTCRAFNERWPVVQAQAETWADEMDSAIAAARTIFGAEHACHKWSGTRWERSFNKAIFDVQVGALSTASVRDAAIQKSEDIEAAFKALCTYDAEFSNAISTTTKSLAATRTRFSRWYEVMSQVTGLPVPVPASIRL